MNTKKTLVFSLVTIVVIFSTALAAQDKKLKKSDLPAAVQKSADEVSKGATVRGYSSEKEDGKLEYEVRLTVNGHSKDVTIAPDGTVLEVEEEVAMDALPAAVRDGLKKEAGIAALLMVIC